MVIYFYFSCKWKYTLYFAIAIIARRIEVAFVSYIRESVWLARILVESFFVVYRGYKENFVLLEV